MDDVTQGMDAPVEAEKLLSADHVNKIVQREKALVADKVRREMEAQHQAQLQQMQAQNQAPPQANGGSEQNSDEIEARIYQRIMDEATKQQQEQEQQQHKQAMEQTASQYFLKMGKGHELFDDFKETMASFNPASFPQVVFLAAELENTPELMYEMAKNPHKLATIDYLAQRDPLAAKAELAKLANSIEANKKAKDENIQTNPPLSRIKSSSVGGDNGKMTVRDLKSLPSLRG
jgi:hypothetical protein